MGELSFIRTYRLRSLARSPAHSAVSPLAPWPSVWLAAILSMAAISALPGCRFDVSGVGGGEPPDAFPGPGLDAAPAADASPAAIDAAAQDAAADASVDDASVTDSSVGDAAIIDAAPTPDAPSLCADTRRVWEADFSADPTALDLDGDSVADWVVRNGAGFPRAELDGGVWHASANLALDTQPKDAFDGLTMVEVRMRNIERGGEGAVFWINADTAGDTYAALYLSLTLRPNGTQTLRLYSKRDNRTRETLHEQTRLGTGFVDVRLAIDAARDQVGIWIDGVDFGARNYFTFPRPDDNRFATVIAYGSASEFDHVRIETCAP